MLLATIPINKYWRKNFLLLFAELMQNSLITIFGIMFGLLISGILLVLFGKKPMVATWVSSLILCNDGVRDEWKK